MNLKAISPLLAAALTVATCYAAGAALIALLGVSLRRAERLPLAFLLGAACMHFGVFALFALGFAIPPVFLVLAGGVIAGAYYYGRRVHGSTKRFPTHNQINPKKFSWMESLPALGYAAIFATFSALYFINAWAPEASADGSAYHLELVARYLDSGGFVPITTNLYAGFGQGAEMLYAPAFALGGHSAPALVHFSFAIALVLGMLAYGRKIGKWWVGAGAALLVYVSPVVGRDASSAYVDVAAAATSFSVFYWLEIWDESANGDGPATEMRSDDRALVAAGLLAGYAYAIKYTGGSLVVYALCFVAWRTWKRGRNRARPLLVIGAWAAAMILPWMIKDWIYLGDPVAPFGASIFRNPYAHISMVKDFMATSRSVADNWKLPLALTMNGGAVQGLLGPVFLAAPLALLALRIRDGRRLLLAACVTLIPFYGHIGARFLIPGLPFIAMAMVLPLANTPGWIAALVMVQALTSWPPVVRSYAGPWVWSISEFPLAAALRIEPEDGFLRRTLPGYGEARFIDKHVPDGARVLLLSATESSYTSREILVRYQASLNQVLSDTLAVGWNPDWQPKVAEVFRFPERHLRRVRILQTARLASGQQWSVHEVRYLRGGVELSRSPGWRLHAWPNPWEVQLAFDNSPATRWRTWETAVPGMYIETDFGGDQAIDEVRVETSNEDRQRAVLQVEAMGEGRQWVRISADPELRENPIRQSLRRAASYQLRVRGIRYLLIQDHDPGAADFADPDSWGFWIVAREPGMTLYKIGR